MSWKGPVLMLAVVIVALIVYDQFVVKHLQA